MIQGYARARGYKKPSQWNAENVISHNYCKKKKEKMARESFTPLKFEVRITAYAKTAHVFQSKSNTAGKEWELQYSINISMFLMSV